MSVFFMDFDMAPSVIWARDLYDQMQIRSDFRKWFPRMCQYGFVEGWDYEFVPRVRPQDEGGRTVQRYVKDYRITLEMAKQLYKLHHFHKNDCFRSCEGQHCMGTDHWMQAVIELLHQHKCKSHAPPKRFYESQPPDSLVTTTQIKSLQQSGAQLTNIVVTDNNIKSFDRVARKYGIDYSLKKAEKEGKTEYLVFFKAKDVDVMTAAFKEYTGVSLKKEQRQSIRKKLERAKERVAKHREITKEKTKDRGQVR